MRWGAEEYDRNLAIEYMRWPEIERRIVDGYTTVVFAVGATEQHGPHLPLNVDELLGTEFAVALARRLGNALMAPTIRPGVSPQHMEFPGTLTWRPETLKLLIEDYVYSLVRHGFSRVVVLSAHFGNRSTVELACQGLQDKLGAQAKIVPIYGLMAYIPREERFAALLEGFHANNFETSLVLHLAPNMVDMALAAPGGVYPASVVDRMIRLH